MPWVRYVLGYHGCDADLARAVVLGNQNLLPSTNEYDWLGHGLYFWEGSPERALRWAQEDSRRLRARIKKPCALGAVIDLGECLNLTDAEDIEILRGAYLRLEKGFVDSGMPLPQNSGRDFRNRKLDCAVFELLHQSRESQALPSFDTARAFFVEGEPLYSSAGIRSLDHVQICVRNPKKIVGYFLRISA